MKDIEKVEDAIEMLDIEKNTAIKEKTELEDLKSEMQDYKEDVQEFKEALKDAGLSEKSLQESKAARRLFFKVNKMINKMDPVIALLNQEKETLEQKIHTHKGEEGVAFEKEE